MQPHLAFDGVLSNEKNSYYPIAKAIFEYARNHLSINNAPPSKQDIENYFCDNLNAFETIVDNGNGNCIIKALHIMRKINCRFYADYFAGAITDDTILKECYPFIMKGNSIDFEHYIYCQFSVMGIQFIDVTQKIIALIPFSICSYSKIENKKHTIIQCTPEFPPNKITHYTITPEKTTCVEYEVKPVRNIRELTKKALTIDDDLIGKLNCGNSVSSLIMEINGIRKNKQLTQDNKTQKYNEKYEQIINTFVKELHSGSDVAKLIQDISNVPSL
jgi:hypothetical protein